MVINTISEISEILNLSEKKTGSLLPTGIIPNIQTGNTRKYYYTTDGLIDFSYKMIEKKTNQTFTSYRDAFLLDNLSSVTLKYNNNCEVITITNQKGGVGKTTSSANLAATLAFLGKKVLLIDMDSQAQSSRYFEKKSHKGNSIMGIFEKYKLVGKVTKEDITPYIKTFELEDFSIDILPSELKLAKMLELMRMTTMPHVALKKIIDEIKDAYNYIIIDTPPYSGLSLEMAIYASDRILLATEAEEFALEGLEVTIEEINEFVSVTNKDLRIDGIIVNSYNKNRTESKECYERIIDMLVDLGLEDENLITNKESALIGKSQSAQLPIIEYRLDTKNAMQQCEDYFKYCTNLILKEV